MAKKKSAAKKTGTKKKSTNMSQAIRGYLETHKNATAKETQAALAKKGIEVSEALIYNVRGRMGNKKTRKKKVKVRAVKKAAERTPIEDMKEAGSLMVKAVELVVSAGAAEAKQLISTASEIVKKAQGGD